VKRSKLESCFWIKHFERTILFISNVIILLTCPIKKEATMLISESEEWDKWKAKLPELMDLVERWLEAMEHELGEMEVDDKQFKEIAERTSHEAGLQGLELLSACIILQSCSTHGERMKLLFEN
jgi:hypothetical protein